jgi:hypothetical protein
MCACCAFPRRSPFILAAAVTLLVTGCAGRIMTQATITAVQVPVVVAVNKLETLDERKAMAFRKASEEVSCVYLKALGSCYFPENDKTDPRVLIQAGRRRYDLIEVQVVCNASVHQYTRDRNGKPSSVSTVVTTEC